MKMSEVKKIKLGVREVDNPEKADTFIAGKPYQSYWIVNQETYEYLKGLAEKDPSIKKMFDEDRVEIDENASND